MNEQQWLNLALGEVLNASLVAMMCCKYCPVSGLVWKNIAQRLKDRSF